jgi:hypothetical protein
MAMTLDDVRAGLRDGSIMFCMPAAHADFTSEFLEHFSVRVLKQHWHDVADRAFMKIPALVDDMDAEEEVASTIRLEYGVEVEDLTALPLWEVIRRCARQSR